MRHSVAWLKLLAAGRRRGEARRAALDLEVMCAVASAMGGKGTTAERLMRALKEQAAE